MGEGVKPGRNVTFGPTPVCVYPPFVFVVSNASLISPGSLNCSASTCFYSQCWNASDFGLAIIARMPRWMPVLVDAPHAMTILDIKEILALQLP